MALQPKEQAAVQQALQRGMSQGKIDKFLAANDGDFDRLRTQKTDKEISDEEASRGVNAPAPAAPMPGGGGVGPTAPPAALAGLAAAGPAPAESIQPQVEGGGGGEVSLPGVGMLRQNLGQRIPPSLMSPLAGLKKLY